MLSCVPNDFIPSLSPSDVITACMDSPIVTSILWTIVFISAPDRVTQLTHVLSYYQLTLLSDIIHLVVERDLVT